MAFQITQGATGTVNPAIAALDTGWTVSDGFAYHKSCNAGIMKALNSLGLIVGHQYTFFYTIDQYVNNTFKLIAGTTNGATRNAAGDYTETLTCATNAELSFYSDGTLRLSKLKFFDVADGVVKGGTISFNPDTNQWGAEYSFQQEVYINFNLEFYSLKNGGLWKHNVNPIRGNFNGVQYPAQVLIYSNHYPESIKIWYSMRVNSNRVWYCKDYGDITILPVEQRPAGMASRLTKNRFKNYQGAYFADFLFNILDPRFSANTQVEALFQAEELRGRVMSILLTNDDTIEVKLFEVDFETSPSAFTY